MTTPLHDAAFAKIPKETLADLLKPEYKGKVALAGDPRDGQRGADGHRPVQAGQRQG